MDVSTELLDRLSAPDAEQVRLRMSWTDYLALDVGLRADWVDGEVVVSPPVAPPHGESAIELALAIRVALPALVMMTEVGLRLPRDRVRVPDLMVSTTRSTGAVVEDPPVLVAEVLSPSTRSEDLLRKAPEYAEGGVGQLWLVDPAHSTIDVSVNVGGSWQPLLHLDDEHPVGEVVVEAHGVRHGVVPLDLAVILRR